MFNTVNKHTYMPGCDAQLSEMHSEKQVYAQDQTEQDMASDSPVPHEVLAVFDETTQLYPT